MRRHVLILAGALLLNSGGALAQTSNFDDQPPAPAGYGASGTLIKMCNENDVLAAQRECQGKIRTYENTIRDFERRKARKDVEASPRQAEWLRGLQHDLSQYRDACARIEDGLRQLRAHPETRCDATGGERQGGR